MERESKYRIPKIVVIFFSMVAYETFFPSLFYEYFAAALLPGGGAGARPFPRFFVSGVARSGEKEVFFTHVSKMR